MSELKLTTPGLAVVCLGHRWWGDPTLNIDGSPVALEDPKLRLSRSEQAAAEREGVADEIAALPAGCHVIHSPARGAPRLFAEAAGRAGLPVIVAPNDALIDVTLGLQHRGWLVKVLVATAAPTGAVFDEIAQTLHDQGVYVKPTGRFVEADIDEYEAAIAGTPEGS